MIGILDYRNANSININNNHGNEKKSPYSTALHSFAIGSKFMDREKELCVSEPSCAERARLDGWRIEMS